ncbi:MAG: phosphomannomutase/phosphoglucomutase [Alphaproteobacteria bacterium]|nr:MAG: phosphomannomutase/phosphoglucomutase [Alphaproteobacteria bacterium]
MSHAFDTRILKPYDIRGIYGENLGEADAYAVGQCFGTILRDRGEARVCVGRDGRESSPTLEKNLIQGLVACGLDVLNVGLVPTPAVYFSEQHFAAGGAIMITASHNPADHNGFKMTLGQRSFYGDDIQRFAQLAKTGMFAVGAGTVTTMPIFDPYVQQLYEKYTSRYADVRPLTVVWDCGNGAAGDVVQALVAKLPGTHTVLNAVIDGTFPAHHPDPVRPENMVQLQEEVLARAADLGVAFDGDGDRIGIVDDKGRMFYGDQLLQLLAQEVLKNNPGALIVADVKASQMCFDSIEAAGGKARMCRTGHAFVKQMIKESGALLAGEMSGHMFFADDYYGFDDALYAALRCMGCVANLSTPLSHWYDGLPKIYNTPELSVACSYERKYEIVRRVAQYMKQGTARIIDIDGVRAVYPDGWWLLRASNTSDKIVARIEAKDDMTLQSLRKEVNQYINDQGIHEALT